MHWIDATTIGFYGIVVIAIGFRFSGQQHTSKDYLLAGRSMGWLVVSISQLASLLSAISYLGGPGEVYNNDLRYVVLSICGYLVIPLVIYFFLNFFYRLETASIYEYLERRFNYPTRALACLIFILARLAWMATIVSAVALAIERLTGLGQAYGIVAATVISASYTLLGGMKAIIWTDVMQFLLFTAGLVGALVVIGWQDSPEALYQVAVEHDKLRTWDFSFDPTARVTVWIAVTAGIVSGLANLTDQVSMQRYLSAGSLAQARRAVWIKPLISIPVMLLLYLLGLALFGHYQLHPELAIGLTEGVEEGAKVGDMAFPHFIAHEMPVGLSGILIAAIFAAAMSSIDSGIHTLSTVCTVDYYKRIIRKDATDHHCLAVARWLTLIWAVLIMVIALSNVGKESIFEMMFSISAPFFGCAVGIFILGTATRRATAWATFSGAIIGYGCVLLVKYGIFRVDGQWHLMPWSFDPGTAQEVVKISKFWLPFISFVGTVVPAYLISLAMAHPPPEKLKGLTVWDPAPE